MDQWNMEDHADDMSSEDLISSLEKENVWLRTQVANKTSLVAKLQEEICILRNSSGDCFFRSAGGCSVALDHIRRIEDLSKALILQSLKTAYYNGQGLVKEETEGPNGKPMWMEYLVPEARKALGLKDKLS
jgi:hypothetical protein